MYGVFFIILYKNDFVVFYYKFIVDVCDLGFIYMWYFYLSFYSNRIYRFVGEDWGGIF